MYVLNLVSPVRACERVEPVNSATIRSADL